MIRALNTAVSSLFAQQRRIETISHNIANAGVDGYAREQVRLTTGTVTGSGGWTSGTIRTGTGVRVLDISRVVNEVSVTRLNAAAANEASTATTASIYDRLEQLMPEPSATGFAERLGQFWDSWGNVALGPDSTETRITVLADAEDLVDGLRTMAAGIQDLNEASRNGLVDVVREVNDITSQIAALNQSLGGIDQGISANNLADQRDALMTRLSELTGAVSYRTEDGSYEVSAGGRVLVSGSSRYELEARNSDVIWAGDGAPVPALGGKAGALQQTMTQIVPEFTALLDNVAAQLVSSVNALHTTGYDLNGNTGLNFFDPAGVTASTIAVSSDVAGQPARIAAGASATPGDGNLADRLSALISANDGADARYRTMIGTLGVDGRSARLSADSASALKDAAKDAVAQESGVNIDEELTNMIEAQRAYAASARVISAVDEMLGVLIERTGVVGR